MEETRTRFWAAMPASRRANSKDVSRSLCLPTPLVKKIRLGTMSLDNSEILRFLIGRIVQSNIGRGLANMKMLEIKKRSTKLRLRSDHSKAATLPRQLW